MSRRALALVLLMLVMGALGAASAAPLSLAEARRAVQEMRAPQGISAMPVPDGLNELEQVLRTHGDWKTLAALLTTEGKFDEAVKVAEQVGGAPLAEARSRAAAAGIAAKQLAPGHVVVRVEPFTGAQWVVLSARVTTRTPWLTYDDVRLSVLTGKRLAWGARVTDPRDFSPNLLNLAVLRDGTPQVLVSTIVIGGSWIPSYLEVFRGDRPPLARVLSLPSHEPLEVTRRRNVWTVRDTFPIGVSIAHSEQPRWGDIYAYDAAAGRWREVDNRYPDDFVLIRSTIHDALRAHPEDWQLLYYLARAQEIGGAPVAARIFYLKALRAAHKAAQADKNDKAAHDAVTRIRERLRAVPSR